MFSSFFSQFSLFVASFSMFAFAILSRLFGCRRDRPHVALDPQQPRKRQTHVLYRDVIHRVLDCLTDKEVFCHVAVMGHHWHDAVLSLPNRNATVRRTITLANTLTWMDNLITPSPTHRHIQTLDTRYETSITTDNWAIVSNTPSMVLPFSRWHLSVRNSASAWRLMRDTPAALRVLFLHVRDSSDPFYTADLFHRLTSLSSLTSLTLTLPKFVHTNKLKILRHLRTLTTFCLYIQDDESSPSGFSSSALFKSHQTESILDVIQEWTSLTYLDVPDLWTASLLTQAALLPHIQRSMRSLVSNNALKNAEQCFNPTPFPNLTLLDYTETTTSVTLHQMQHLTSLKLLSIKLPGQREAIVASIAHCTALSKLNLCTDLLSQDITLLVPVFSKLTSLVLSSVELASIDWLLEMNPATLKHVKVFYVVNNNLDNLHLWRHLAAFDFIYLCLRHYDGFRPGATQDKIWNQSSLSDQLWYTSVYQETHVRTFLKEG